jgi:hypothetical protein
MSLPLTRRIARAALLIAAGAAPVVGAAGSASAVDLPQTPLDGLTALDVDSLSGTVDGASQKALNLTGTDGDAVKQTLGGLPIVGSLPTNSLTDQLPVDSLPLGSLPTDSLTDGLPTDQLPVDSLPTDSLPTDSLTDQLPVDSLPLGSLPTDSLTDGLPTDQLPVDSLPLG